MTVRSVLSQFEKDPLHFVVKKLSQQASFAFPDGPGTRSSLLSMIVRLQNSRFFFLKISKEIGKAWRKSLTRASLTRRERLSPVSLSVFSLIPDLLFDYSRVLEYPKIQTVLQST